MISQAIFGLFRFQRAHASALAPRKKATNNASLAAKATVRTPSSIAKKGTWYQPAWTPANAKMRKRDLASLLSMLKMLLENGLSLQRALEGLSTDRGCKKHRPMLNFLKGRVGSGESFSKALAAFPKIFNASLLQHIALAEASGTLIESLERIVAHIEESIELRRKLVQKLSYPLLVILAGSGLVAFMLTTVVPQFEKIYGESNVALPWVTSVVTAFSRFATKYLWLLPIAVIGLLIGYRFMRSNDNASKVFDGWLLKSPLLGRFLTDMSALEYLRSALVLSEAGFVPLDAITQAAKSVPNRAARQLLSNVAIEVGQGQKLSAALLKAEHLFPSAVFQLVIVGEQSGGVTQACHGSCEIVKKQLENRLNAVLGSLEPILTIGLAACIGWIVLAIYMPMFHMFDVLDIK